MPEKLLYEFSHFLFDPGQRALLRDGQHVRLYPKNLLLLKTLIEADGRILGKDELMAAVWPDAVVEEGNLAKNISQLRKALGNGAKSEEFIETIPTIGYRFRAEVTTVKSQNGFERQTLAVTGQNGDQPKGTMAVKTDDVTPPVPVAKPVRRRWLWAGLAVALVIGATAVWLKWPPPQTAQTAANEFAPVRLTNHIAVDSYPEYSPDGKKIAFSSNRDGLAAIYLMNADGSDARRLVNDLEGNTPHWSPDGKKVYFWGANAAYEVNVNGSGLAKLPNPNGLLSPDGQKIVMVKLLAEGVQASVEIFVANPDGSEPVRLTNNQSLDADPFWSPDSKRIAFPASRTDLLKQGRKTRKSV